MSSGWKSAINSGWFTRSRLVRLKGESQEMAGHCEVSGPLLDVRNQSSLESDNEVKDIYAYGAGLQSTIAIVGLSRFTNLQTLSLHGNQIQHIEGLEVLHQLVSLNLSSNKINCMVGLSQLKSLKVLNLANNRIEEISGLQGLLAIRTLVLSHNRISLLGGLSALQGPQYALQHLDLRDNIVAYLCELWILAGCLHLEEVIFQYDNYSNPVCKASAYQSTLLAAVPNICTLDGASTTRHFPVFNANIYSVPPLPIWAAQHCYPPNQPPVNSIPAVLQPLLRNANSSSNPCPVLLRDHQKNDISCLLKPVANCPHSRGLQICPKHNFQLDWKTSCEQGQEDQGRFQGLNFWNVTSHDYHQHVPGPYQIQHAQRTHALCDAEVLPMAAEEHNWECLDENVPHLECNCLSNAIITQKYSQQGEKSHASTGVGKFAENDFIANLGRGIKKERSNRVAHPGRPRNVESQCSQHYLVKGKLDGLTGAHDVHNVPKDITPLRPSEIPGCFAPATNCGRYVRCVDRSIKSGLKERTNCTFKESSEQTELVSGPLLEQPSQEVCCRLVSDFPRHRLNYFAI